VFIKDTIGQTKLTMAEISELKKGKALLSKQITDKNGKTYNVVLQVSADRKTDEIVEKASEVFVSKVTSNLTPII